MAENELINKGEEESDAERDYRLLKQFGVARPAESDTVDMAVRKLGGVLGRVESPTGKVIRRTPTGGYTDGETLVEYGNDGEIVKRDNDGTTYDEEGNVLTPGQPKD